MKAKSMSLVDVVSSRRSIRRYEKREIPKDVLDKVLEAGRQAPSAANRQPFHFIVITNQELRKELSRGLFNRFIQDSAVTVVGCANTSEILTAKWAVVDTSIALQNMVIEAWTLGIGSCWIGDFKEDNVKQLLEIPDRWKVVALVSFGYPAEQPQPRKKKPIEELVSYNKF
jgi:nitroreductase